jgi:transposase
VGATTARRGGLLKGKTVAIDATTLEANAAMRSIVRRDTGESYQAFLTRLAEASGLKTPTREALARLDRKRKKKTSNKDWKHPGDPDAKVAKMKDGRTHLAHKAEHAVDLETGAIVAVTVRVPTKATPRRSSKPRLPRLSRSKTRRRTSRSRSRWKKSLPTRGITAIRRWWTSMPWASGPTWRSRTGGRRDWSEEPEAQAPVYRNRRRIRGRRGRRLMRRRGEFIERSFAHLYDTGGMRRTHLRGHSNILKRVLIHAGAFNLGLSCAN